MKRADKNASLSGHFRSNHNPK